MTAEDQAPNKGLYKIKTIADMTGFSPNLLRAWERRYELLEPDRKPSGHRLYTEEDRKVLMAVRALMRQGRSIGEIAAEGRESLLRGPSAVPAAPSNPTRVPEDAPPQAVRLSQALVEASLALDPVALESLLDESFASLAREDVFSQIIVPALRRVGDLWAEGKASVAHEHLASDHFARRIQQWLTVAKRQATKGPRVLVACLPQEHHEIAALLVSYHLAVAGSNVTFLGNLPLNDLELACRDIEPEMVTLSVTRPALFDIYKDRLRDLVTRLPKVRFLMGGTGLHGREHEVVRLGAEFWPPERDLSELAQLV